MFKEGGIIFLEVVSDRNRGMMDRTSYWGRRFETLCVLGVEGARLDELHRGPNDPPRSSYCALFRSRLGSHNVLMGEAEEKRISVWSVCWWYVSMSWEGGREGGGVLAS